MNSFAARALAIGRSVEKDIEAADHFKAAGAEVILLGDPSKRLALSSLTLRTATLPLIFLTTCCPTFWKLDFSIVLYRRCLSSLVDDFFALEAECEDCHDATFAPLSWKAAQELAMLAAMAPLMCSNVASPVAPSDCFEEEAVGRAVLFQVTGRLCGVLRCNFQPSSSPFCAKLLLGTAGF